MTERTLADFFAGIGLARMGLEAAGWRSVFANDADPNKKFMYEMHFGPSEDYDCGDVADLNADEIPDAMLWWASFPCTDLSLAGSRKGLLGLQSGSLISFLDLLEQKDGQRPSLVVLENVIGFVTSKKGTDFISTISRLNALGYSCDAFVLNAVNFIPQSRPRLFIVGVFDAPATDNVTEVLVARDEQLKTNRLTDVIASHPELSWLIHALPSPPPAGQGLKRVLERIPASSSRWWSEERVAYLLDQMSERHVQIVKDLRGQTKVTYATVFRRMRARKSMAEIRTDDVAGCLRTPKGGSSRQIVIVLGKGRIRARFMTPREYARLMGAPHYRFSMADYQAYFGFGDAVCVPVVEWIGRSVLNPHLESTTEKSEKLTANVG